MCRSEHGGSIHSNMTARLPVVVTCRAEWVWLKVSNTVGGHYLIAQFYIQQQRSVLSSRGSVYFTVSGELDM